jgi:hypothetical protein
MKFGSTAIIPMLLQRFEVAIDLLNLLKVVVSGKRVLRTWG